MSALVFRTAANSSNFDARCILGLSSYIQISAHLQSYRDMRNLALSVRICPIDSLAELAVYQRDWERMYWADRHASPFLHWNWMTAWFKVSPYPWMVLVAMTDDRSECLGFMPISHRGVTHRHRLDQVRELHMAGDPASDYNGFLCAPRSNEWERAAIAGFAQFVAEELPWDQLRLKEMDDPRLNHFLESMPRANLRLAEHRGTCCPRLLLPDRWDEYLRSRLTPPSRKSLKKRLRLAAAECHLTVSNPSNIHQFMQVLQGMALRQRSNLQAEIGRSCATLRSLAHAGCAEVSLLWRHGLPIAAQGSVIDWKRKSVGHSIATYDADHASLSPGRVLDALCIQHAIERGFHEVDFLRGDEAYKFQFGATAHYTRHVRATRMGFETTTRRAINFMRESLRI